MDQATLPSQTPLHPMQHKLCFLLQHLLVLHKNPNIQKDLSPIVVRFLKFQKKYILIIFLIIWGLLFPLIGVIPKVREMISLRYLTLIVWLACMIGVIVNFGALADSVKMAVVIGTGVLSGIFILVRSYEKVSYNHDLKASVSKGDAKAEIEIKNVENGEKDESDLKGLAKYEQGER